MTRTKLQPRIAAALLGVLVGLLLLELGLRAYGGVFLWQQQWRNQRALEQADATRVLCIGESTTAMGGESSYPAQLEQILNDGGGDRAYRVINRGIPGTDSSVLIDDLQANLEQFDPHVVVAMMGANDYGEALPFGDGPAVEQNGFPHSLKVYRLVLMLGQQWGRSGTEAPAGPGQPDPVTLLKRHRAEHPEQHLRDGANALSAEVAELTDEAKIRLEQGRHAEAEELLREAIAFDLRQGTQDDDLASLSRRIARHEELVKLYLTSLNKDGGGVTASALYARLEDCGVVRAGYLALLEAQPDNDFLAGRFARHLRHTGDLAGAERWLAEARAIRDARFRPMTKDSYRTLQRLCRERGVLLICAQYPTRSLAPLRALFDDAQGVVFVDNEETFTTALRSMDYDSLFIDDYYGDFGHATHQGNRLLAENVAAAILQAQ